MKIDLGDESRQKLNVPGHDQKQLKQPPIPEEMGESSCLSTSVNNDRVCEGHRAFQNIAIDDLQKLNTFCEDNGQDLETFLAAVWSVVLHRFSGVDMVRVGLSAPEATRCLDDPPRKAKRVLVVEINTDATIKELLCTTNHCIYHPDTSDSCHTDADLVFTHTNASEVKTFSARAVDNHTACGINTQGNDVLLIVENTDAKLNMMLRYHTSILSEYQARNLAGTMARAISCFLEDQNQRVRDLSLFSHQSLHDVAQWNRRGATTVYSESIIGIIAAKCRSQARGQAICAWDGVVSYGDLDKLSSKLAAHLRGLGVDAKAMVPVCFDKSLWAVVAMLAVSKAGAAFVPMDATHPVQRLKQIISRVNARLVLASDRPARLLVDTAEHVITVSESMIMQLPGTGLSQSVLQQPYDAAYVLFTSGSTGNPKGCVVEHRALAAVADHAEAFRIKADSRVIQFASYSFTVCIIEIFCTLAAGGTVCIPSEHDRLNDLSGAMNKMEVTWALLARSVVNSLDSKLVPGLETLVVAGEPLCKDLIKLWAQRVHLVQAYGVTESAGVCTVQPNITAVGDSRNIGMSPHATVWVVNPDNYHVLAPVGAIGELLIESPCLAREYLHDAEKTAAAFIYDPVWLQLFGREKGTRLYKTGDLVQYAADGSLCFMGRKDTQVKLRGQRIELGEVEHRVRQCFAGARDVVAEVVTPTEAGRAPMLVAFVLVGDEGRAESKEDILTAPTDAFREAIPAAEAELHDAVPAYMVPAVFLPLAAVPLTATGKTDRRRLRERAALLSRAEIEASTGPVAAKRPPTTAAERTLQGLWAQALNLSPNAIGADDSFFHLGGDSLTAMRVATLSHSAGLNVSVADIFKHRRLSLICSMLSPLASSASRQLARPLSLVDQDISLTDLSLSSQGIDPSNIVDVIPATESQIWFLTQWSSSFFSFLLRGQMVMSRLQCALKQLVQKHASLRTVFCEHRGNILQIILERALPYFEYIHTDRSLESVFRDVCDRESKHPSLSIQPFKVMLVSRSEEEHLLVLRLSHAQYDAYSLSPLLQDLSSAYNNYSLPVSTTVSFPDYIYFCRQQPSEHANQFWSELLNGSRVTRLPLPSANESDDIVSIHESASTSLPPLPQDTTYPILVNSSVALVLSKLVDSGDVVFGLGVNTRSIPMQGIDSVVGPCINVLPFRVILQQDQSASNLCMKVREQYADISQYCHLELPDIAGTTDDWWTARGSLPFGCLVNHIPADEISEALSLEGLSCSSFSKAARINLPNQVLIRSIVQGGELCIEILTSTDKRARDCSKFVSWLATAVLSTVEQVSEKFSSPLSSMDINLDGLSIRPA